MTEQAEKKWREWDKKGHYPSDTRAAFKAALRKAIEKEIATNMSGKIDLQEAYNSGWNDCLDRMKVLLDTVKPNE